MGRFNGEGHNKVPTGVAGFDQIVDGGIPRNRTMLVAGTAGSGKTVLAIQYLWAGITMFDEPGVLVTCEEAPEDIVSNVSGFGWTLQQLIETQKLSIVDASPTPGASSIEIGSYDLSALMARIENAITKVGAKRVVIDAVGALYPQFGQPDTVRRELYRLSAALRKLDVTTLITVERVTDDGHVARHGVEEFVADNVMILRNRLEHEKRRRTIEVLKLRGSPHQKGEYPFTIDPSDAINVVPLSAVQLTQKSSDVRLSFGVEELDRMCGGGLFRDSIILVSGATGTGKTCMVTGFMDAAIRTKQRGLLFAFEESRQQLYRNAASWGADFEKGEREGWLRIVSRYPEAMGLEDHLIHMKREIEEFQPQRMAVDSMSALERVSSLKSFREFVIGVTSHIKHKEIAGLFTNTTSLLSGGESVTETHVSTITDSIILLRYVELLGEMRRGLTILKMRGSWHDKGIREYRIGQSGMAVLEPFHGVSGILAGKASYLPREEHERLSAMFSTPHRGD